MVAASQYTAADHYRADVAASLIADAMFFFVCMFPDTIINRLADAGVRAELMQPLDGSEDASQPLLRVAATAGDRCGSPR